MTSRPIIETIDQVFDLAGVLALVVGALVTGANYLIILVFKPAKRSVAYSALRKGLGRAILVGLEVLVAADIIRTVAIEPSVQNVLVLGLIVVIRTFLSWSLEVEITGRWPWQSSSVPSTSYLGGAPSSTVDHAVSPDG